MVTYRSHINNLAMNAAGEAMRLGLLLSQVVALRHTPEYREKPEQDLGEIRFAVATLNQAIDKLLSALPSEVSTHPGNLKRQLRFIDFNLKNGDPWSCAQDPIDIVRGDLPGILSRFDAWYAGQSALDSELSTRLMPFITSGQLNAAIREAWAIFKTRIVKQFELADELDSYNLVTTLFGSNGVTVGLLPDKEREGYLNLFKGLYALSRNPTAHNDTPPNPAEVDAVLTLISSTLVKIEKLTAEGRHVKIELAGAP